MSYRQDARCTCSYETNELCPVHDYTTITHDRMDELVGYLTLGWVLAYAFGCLVLGLLLSRC